MLQVDTTRALYARAVKPKFQHSVAQCKLRSVRSKGFGFAIDRQTVGILLKTLLLQYYRIS